MDENQQSSVTQGMLEACFFGFHQPYQDSLALMHGLHEAVSKNQLPNQLMLLEHAPVITVTRSHEHKSLKTSPEAIKNSGIDLVLADRGGDATFHGPGQLVGYPIIALKECSHEFVDISSYIRSLEGALLRALHKLSVYKAQVLPGFTGIWVRGDHEGRVHLKKLVAIGVGIKDGVTKHGFALNIDIDHERFVEHIIPCGLKDRGVMTLKEYFSKESLEMPSHSVMVKTISECLSQTFSLTLTWRE